MTDTESTSAFRRFPWLQFVFCIACLSMAGWMWMRDSRALSVDPTRLSQDMRTDRSLWEGRYVSLRGKAINSFLWGQADKRLAIAGMCGHAPDSKKFCRRDHAGIPLIIILPWPGRGLPVSGEELVVTGRVLSDEQARRVLLDAMQPPPTGRRSMSFNFGGFIVLAEATHWTAGSIAGLVVGAMGVFIFGLYLRAWLRERKALASEPPQDMIA